MKKSTLWAVPVLILGLFAGSTAAHADEIADAGLTMKVKLQLLEKLGAEALEINVDSKNGAVRLSGDVEKRASLELATSITKSVGGVASVDNDLTLENPEGKTKVERAAGEVESEVKDAILESRIRIALIDAIGGTGFKIGTEAADGAVVLEIPADVSRSDRERSVAAVRALDGVKKVSTVDKKS